ncbi:hypothetical protein U9M48_042464 [Paspalum notatum var. saurae]|uniref:Uncharacterized protein n=1 Tax=Paspalum notatum var. saurae TaxID=547442 RepID=A0AAQ3XHL8_PASNO
MEAYMPWLSNRVEAELWKRGKRKVEHRVYYFTVEDVRVSGLNKRTGCFSTGTCYLTSTVTCLLLRLCTGSSIQPQALEVEHLGLCFPSEFPESLLTLRTPRRQFRCWLRGKCLEQYNTRATEKVSTSVLKTRTRTRYYAIILRAAMGNHMQGRRYVDREIRR